MRARGPIAVFGACWCVAIVVTWLLGPRLEDLGLVVVVPVAWLTWTVTTQIPAAFAPAQRIRAQLVVLAIYTVYSIGGSLRYHGYLDSPIYAPIDAIEQAVAPYVGRTGRVLNPLLDVVVPGLAIWLLGARGAELGLARGRYTLRVLAIWATPLVLFLIGLVVFAGAAPATIGAHALDHTVHNGPVEEFYWRGLVQTRLEHRFGATWAIVVATLAFGLVHVGAQLAGAGDDVPLAAARAIVDQAVVGLAFAVMFYRTRSLIASSIVHVLFDTCGTVAGWH